MIENREQRKKSSLLRRRKIIIIISVLLVVASGIALYFINEYVNNVIPYVDPADGTTYYIKLIDGTWALYNKSGSKLPTESTFGYYVTAADTLVEVRPKTGEYFTRAVPDVSDGELTEYEKILIFKHVESSDIRSIEVYNQHDKFTFYRFNIETMKTDDKADFVLRSSPLLTLKKDLISALNVAAGYALASSRVDDPVKNENGEIDLFEYGLAPEKRTKTEIDENGNEITVEYDYKPSYYILTTKNGEKYKMLIGDRLINGNGYYAQYVEINGETETPRNKIYVLNSSLKNSVLAEVKTFVTPGIAYPVTQSDYFDVTDFLIREKVNGTMKNLISFSYVDIADRTGTIEGSRPYVFTDNRSNAYYPNYDRIDKCLLAFMQPNIIDIAILSPSPADRTKYGLMRVETDADGNPVLNENGSPKYVYDAKYVVSFKRSAKDSAGNIANFLQTVYISEKNKNGNYYSYTTLTFLDEASSKTDITGITFDMICEVSGDTFNFLSYDEFDWTYPNFIETGIKYATSLTLKKPDYLATFKITNNETEDKKYNAVSTVASSSTGKEADTFGMLDFTDAQGNKWHVTETDFTITMPNGQEGSHVGSKRDVDDIGQKVKYIAATDKTPEYITVNDGVINRVYIRLNEIRIEFKNGTVKTYVRYQTTLFKKLFVTINQLALVDDYYLSEEDEAALLADPSKYLASISLSTDDGKTVNVDFYTLTSRKAYIVINGEGGYYVSTSAIKDIFDNSEKFFNLEDINYQ